MQYLKLNKTPKFVVLVFVNIIIANPIFDTVFKRMMENERVAEFFLGILLELQIETIKVKP